MSLRVFSCPSGHAFSCIFFVSLLSIFASVSGQCSNINIGPGGTSSALVGVFQIGPTSMDVAVGVSQVVPAGGSCSGTFDIVVEFIVSSITPLATSLTVDLFDASTAVTFDNPPLGGGLLGTATVAASSLSVGSNSVVFSDVPLVVGRKKYGKGT